jgi:hypothetical protein
MGRFIEGILPEIPLGMRIELVTDTFAPEGNGGAMTLGRLVEGLRRRGHLVHV